MEKFKKATAQDFIVSPETGVSSDELQFVAKKIYDVPEVNKLFKKSQRLLSDRKKMFEETKKLDWAMGELLAYGTLLNEGHPVRLSGQDVERGTFSHRHAVLKLEASKKKFAH